jgi:molybdate transport system substrate-binding protein
MKRRRLVTWIGTAIASLLLVLGLQLIEPLLVTAQRNASVLVSAAASLKEVMEELQSVYQKSNPNTRITYNFAASGALQQQIERGAPVDVFISAAQRQMDALAQKGLLVPGTRTNLANNRLVLIVPRNKTGITSFYNLTNANVRRIAIGEPRSVPAGQYAEQVLRNLKLWDQVKPKLVLANNVRQVLAAVESGNADAGLVYATDARISNQVKVVVAASEKYHSPIVYPIAVLKRSKNAAAAKQFVQFLSTNQAKAVLRKYGFIVPR